MSADLWAAFSESDDLSKNPWSQAPITPASPAATRVPLDVVKAGTLGQGHLVKTEGRASDSQALQSPWSSSHGTSSAHQPSFRSQNQAFDGLIDSTAMREDIWSGWESPTVSANAWATEEASSGRPHIESAQAEIANVTDDWGDFEDPHTGLTSNIAGLGTNNSFALAASSSAPTTEAKSGPTSLYEEDSQQRKEVRISSVAPSGTGFTRANKPIDIAHGKAMKGIQPSQDRLKQNQVPIGDSDPDVQDEWSEWSPEPIPSSNFSAAMASKGTSGIVSAAQGINSTKPKLRPTEVTSQKKASPQSSIATMPPTNVPPPSILISLISGLVEKLPGQIDSAMQSLAQSGGSNKALEPAIRKCIAALRVAARVIAGRKLRWKRDTHLAQSMRIGQAGKGMKLSGVDRNEVKREDREAAEFVQIWQKRLGGIRRALALVNIQVSGSPLALPEVSETMLIRTAKLVDGGITAPKCCVLCGIKRDERVEKVDGDIYDSFSEWWTEHWGHTDCKEFWIEHEKYLQQR